MGKAEYVAIISFLIMVLVSTISVIYYRQNKDLDDHTKALDVGKEIFKNLEVAIAKIQKDIEHVQVDMKECRIDFDKLEGRFEEVRDDFLIIKNQHDKTWGTFCSGAIEYVRPQTKGK